MWKKLLQTTLLVALLTVAAGWWAANQLAHPPRRPLQDYHQEFLDQPAAHGVRVFAFTTTEGTPYLVCERDSAAPLGKRGTLLRQQLEARGIPLPPTGQIIGTLVLVHGRRGRKEDFLPVAERLCAVGFRCIIPDLPAHGQHPHGTITFGVLEGGLPAQVLQQASARLGVSTAPAGIIGLSMGGAVSMRALAAPQAPWRAAALLATFDDLDQVLRHQCASYLGAPLGSLWRLSTQEFFQWTTSVPTATASSLALAPRVQCPVLVAHGTSDEVIPIACGRRLFEALPPGIEKRWLEVPQAGHDNLLVTDFPLYAALAEWMLARVPDPPFRASAR